MNGRIAALAAVTLTTVVLSVGLVAAACGGTRTPLEEYFHSAADIEEEVLDRSDALADRMQEQLGDAEDDSERLNVLRGYFESLAELTEDHVDDLREVVPLLEVEAEHNDWVEANVDSSDYMLNGLDALQNFDSPTEMVGFFQDFLSDPESIRLSGAIDEACFALQEVADSEGIDDDLLCGDALG